ncbi:MAG: ATP-binding protein, partial [Acidobacteria bacterium]
TADYDRVSMHGVRRELVQRQAQSLGVSLEPIWISKNASNEEYESKLLQALRRYQDRGVRRAVFGDLFLEDIRAYRENVLGRIGMSGIYPIWQRDTTQMAQDFIALGFRAIVICVDSRVLPASFAGKVIDQELLRSLPPGVDPCGENGEFHTFVYAGPILSEEVRFTAGEVVLRDSFYFCELSSEFRL